MKLAAADGDENAEEEEIRSHAGGEEKGELGECLSRRCVLWEMRSC